MKISEKSFKVGAVCLLLFAACTQQVVDRQVIAEWRFVSIQDSAGADVRQIGPEDLMKLRQDKTFSYRLALEDISAHGEWQIERDVLIYSYDEDKDGTMDYQRIYKVKTLTDSTLVLNEEGIDYSFRKVKN